MSLIYYLVAAAVVNLSTHEEQETYGPPTNTIKVSLTTLITVADGKLRPPPNSGVITEKHAESTLVTSSCCSRLFCLLISFSRSLLAYYRCSAREGCMARKRVERKKNDPSLLIITYTGSHNHPLPPFENSAVNSNDGDNNENNSTSSLHVSPATNNVMETKIVEDMKENINSENVFNEAMDYDVFATLDEIVGLSDGES
ncbi:hypothetical protein L1887_41839 [Cichorium endivia]|nr:hypothetical protein L1887_41839 [Cichorium endivia]